MSLEISESEFISLIEDDLSRAKFFSCVISYENTENLAWYTALRVGEIIRNYFASKLDRDITIHLTLEITRIVSNLNVMEENDVLLLSIDNENIKPISSHLASETLTNKRNIIFISNKNNPLMKKFEGITFVKVYVKNLSENMLNCMIKILDKGERILELNLPEEELIKNYLELKGTLLKETIRR